MFVETSPRRERDFAMGMEVMLREVDFWRARMEGSVCWAVAMSMYDKGRGRREGVAVEATEIWEMVGRERASATTFLWPGRC